MAKPRRHFAGTEKVAILKLQFTSFHDGSDIIEGAIFANIVAAQQEIVGVVSLLEVRILGHPSIPPKAEIPKELQETPSQLTFARDWRIHLDTLLCKLIAEGGARGGRASFLGSWRTAAANPAA